MWPHSWWSQVLPQCRISGWFFANMSCLCLFEPYLIVFAYIDLAIFYTALNMFMDVIMTHLQDDFQHILMSHPSWHARLLVKAANSNPVTGSYSRKAVTWRKEARTLKAWHRQNPTFIARFKWLQSEIVQGAVELERDNQEKLQKKVQDFPALICNCCIARGQCSTHTLEPYASGKIREQELVRREKVALPEKCNDCRELCSICTRDHLSCLHHLWAVQGWLFQALRQQHAEEKELGPQLV